ncbi:odorant receptor 131-2-like [Engraulis encrasicolus]|uniref:odorant receptor 131-2-like n=1 Tax=Engraulis encrasicolus TaxID=184585 RepID=UPI002FD58947
MNSTFDPSSSSSSSFSSSSMPMPLAANLSSVVQTPLFPRDSFGAALAKNIVSMLGINKPLFPRDSFGAALAKNIVSMLVWLALTVMNCSMVRAFLRHSVFYEDPRYVMFIAMVLNDTLQLALVTALYVVSYAFSRIHAGVCSVLIVAATTTTRATPLILAGMAVERYVSICFPLHYGHMCTLGRTLWLILGVLALTSAVPLTDLFITLATRPPNVHFRAAIFCDHSIVFAGEAIYIKNCIVDTVYLSFVFLTIVYTYVKIMLAARAAASTDYVSVHRARNTVLLHGVQLLLCMLAFVVPSMQAPLIRLFPMHHLEIRYVNFLLVYIIPRFLSPMIYGFRDEKFRRYWLQHLLRTCRQGGRGGAKRVRPGRGGGGQGGGGGAGGAAGFKMASKLGEPLRS